MVVMSAGIGNLSTASYMIFHDRVLSPNLVKHLIWWCKSVCMCVLVCWCRDYKQEITNTNKYSRKMCLISKQIAFQTLKCEYMHNQEIFSVSYKVIRRLFEKSMQKYNLRYFWELSIFVISSLCLGIYNSSSSVPVSRSIPINTIILDYSYIFDWLKLFYSQRFLQITHSSSC